MKSLFNLVADGQKGDNASVEALAGMDWFRACISELLDNVWESYGGKMFADVYDNMDYDYILILLSFMCAKQTCTPTKGNDIETRLGDDKRDQAAKAYVRKYIRTGVFKGEWNKVFYSYAYEIHPSIGNNVAAFKRNLNVYVWFLSNSVTKADLDKSDDEIIASIDIDAVVKRYSKSDEDATTIGDVTESMNNDLKTLRAWFTDMGDFSYADTDNNTQDSLDRFVDEGVLESLTKSLRKMKKVQRDCYLRHEVYDLPNTTIADQLGISEATVRRYCQKAKEAITNALPEIMN